MRRLAVFLIVLRLVADMATPLWPEAFRFDPAQTVEGVGSRAAAPLPPDVNAPSLPEREAFETRTSAPLSVASARMAARPSRRPHWRTSFIPAPPDPGSPRSSEDA